MGHWFHGKVVAMLTGLHFRFFWQLIVAFVVVILLSGGGMLLAGRSAMYLGGARPRQPDRRSILPWVKGLAGYYQGH